MPGPGQHMPHELPSMAELTRFFSRIAVSHRSGCWRWIGVRNGKGYGMFGGRNAHRVSYAWFAGEISAGLEIDHLCRVKNCVNPAHLEAVTGDENRRRANRFETTGRCKRGHELKASGFCLTNGSGERLCMACRVLTRARYLQRHGLHLPPFAVKALAAEASRVAHTEAA